MIPRLLKGWDDPNRGAVSVAAGTAHTMAVNELGECILWEKNYLWRGGDDPSVVEGMG